MDLNTKEIQNLICILKTVKNFYLGKSGNIMWHKKIVARLPVR